ncbi:acyl-CoA synthetase [Streptomyces sp. NPDC059506]|uniref:acyl-CoA synthetase n=1 Tax=Streptomyces sp. NPDC059506 TaxID=3347751 RepID=UPI00369D2B6B
MLLNLAHVFEAVSAAVPDRTAVVCEQDRLTYAELDARANRLAHHLAAAGVRPGQHVALHLLNGVEFVEALLGCLKIRAVPVNVNYRYTDRELVHLYTDSDSVALVVDEEFAAAAAGALDRCPLLRRVVVVRGRGGAGAAAPEWPSGVRAADYEEALAAASPVADFAGRSNDDLYIVYTGGTTGNPKGVMWRHEDFFFAALGGGNPFGEPHRSAEAVAAGAAAMPEMGFLVPIPLMHGAASYTLFTALFMGFKVVLQRRFDPVDCLRLVQEEKTFTLAVVGDAIARPLADAIAAHGAEYDLSALTHVASGGALFSRSVREELRRLLPNVTLRDGFGASESGVDGSVVVGEDGRPRLTVGPAVQVVGPDFRPVAPGSGEPGWVARRGHVPLGYYNDERKTAETFRTVDGVRWVMPGDMAVVEEDGSIVLLGRGSQCINTGGEKVFPEEVEEALKAHPAVLDALVAGVPDPRFGQRVAAVVELRPDAPEPGAADLQAHCRGLIAGYKVPAALTVVPSVVRSPSGKADYRWARKVLSGEQQD